MWILHANHGSVLKIENIKLKICILKNSVLQSGWNWLNRCNLTVWHLKSFYKTLLKVQFWYSLFISVLEWAWMNWPALTKASSMLFWMRMRGLNCLTLTIFEFHYQKILKCLNNHTILKYLLSDNCLAVGSEICQ